MKLYFYFSLIMSLLSVNFAFAQSELPEGFGDYRTIENPEPGKSYTQAYIPPTFKKIVWKDSVLLLENNRHLLTNLEEEKDYNIIMEIVEIRPAYTIWEFEEPTMDTIIETKTIIVDRICEEIEPMPKFENEVIIERKEIFKADVSFIKVPLSEKFIKRCGHILPKNKQAQSFIYALIEIPACYVSIEKRVFQKDGKWWTETIADTLSTKQGNYALNGTIKKSKRYIPIRLDTIHRIVVYEKILNQLSEPIFSTIYKEEISEKEGFTIWKEVLCGPYCGGASFKVTDIQESLKEKGYDIDINNRLDNKTKAALIQFQKDNNLPIGQLDVETLRMLGVE